MNKKRSLDLIRELVRQYLTYFWIRPEDIMRILAPGVAASGQVTECFADSACTTKVDLETITRRVILSSQRDEEPSPAVSEPQFSVIGEINLPPVAHPVPPLLLLTAQMEVILTVESDTARHADGTIQIYGSEPMIMLFTVEQLKKQLGHKKLLDGAAVRRFWLERRGADGIWSREDMQFTLPDDIVHSVERS